MAQLCTQCGTPMGEGMTFCTNCGASAAAPAARAAQPPEVVSPAPLTTPPPGVAPAAVHAGAAPVAAAGKSGRPVLRILLIVLIVLILVGLGGVGGGMYLVYRVKQKANEFKKEAHVTLPTEAGSQEGPAQPEAKPTAEAVNREVPIYPGATPSEAGGDLPMVSGAGKVQEYLTDDTVDQVVSFYKDKLGSGLAVRQSEGKTLMQLVGSAALIEISVFHDDSAGKTKFSISRTGR